MGARWGGLRLGDVVSPVGRGRQMVVTDLDLDDPRQVVCGYREVGPKKTCHERSYRISALVLIKRTTSL